MKADKFWSIGWNYTGLFKAFVFYCSLGELRVDSGKEKHGIRIENPDVNRSLT